MALAETARLIAQLVLDDKLTPGVGKALGSVERLESGFSRASRGAGQLAAGFARSGAIVAGAAVTGLGAAAKAAIDFEDAFAGVVKTVDELELAQAGLTFDRLREDIRGLARDGFGTHEELSGIAEAAGALGVAAKDIIPFTRQVALLATTTDLTAEGAATALGHLQNVLQLTGDEYDNLAASVVDLGNKGASTESQILGIAENAGSAATLIRLAADETLGWAAATANLGIEVEAGGTALQRVFLESQKIVAASGKQLDVMAKTAGTTGDAFKQAFAKDASGALEDFVNGLGKLDAASQIDVLKQLGFSDIRVTRVLLGLANDTDGLSEALHTSADAWEEATAAQIEFEKRQQTVKSAFARLKAGITDAAITLGEGFAPALGRAAKRLAEFLSQDANRSALKNLGEDIGKSIDSIDWKQVLEGAKTFVAVLKQAVSFATRLLDAVMALPTEVKAAGLALFGLDKLSGGLITAGIGNIASGLVSGIVRSLGAQLPGIGKAFVQPVFVTNFPPGLGLGGAGGVAAGTAAGGVRGLLGNLLKFIPVVFAAELANQLEPVSSDIAKRIQRDFIGGPLIDVKLDDLQWPFGPKNTPKILPEIFGGNGLLGGTSEDGRARGGSFGPATGLTAIAQDIRDVLRDGLKDIAENGPRRAEHERTGTRENLVALFHGPLKDALVAAGQRTSYLLSADLSKALPKTLASDIRRMKVIQEQLQATGDTKNAELVGSYIKALQDRLDEINRDKPSNRTKDDAFVRDAKAAAEASQKASEAAREAARIAKVIATSGPPPSRPPTRPEKDDIVVKVEVPPSDRTKDDAFIPVLKSQGAKLDALRDAANRTKDDTVAALGRNASAVGAGLQRTRADVVAAQNATKAATSTGLLLNRLAILSVANAIRNWKPNPTQVVVRPTIRTTVTPRTIEREERTYHSTGNPLTPVKSW